MKNEKQYEDQYNHNEELILMGILSIVIIPLMIIALFMV